jgi:hypothetical protein
MGSRPKMGLARRFLIFLKSAHRIANLRWQEMGMMLAGDALVRMSKSLRDNRERSCGLSPGRAVGMPNDVKCRRFDRSYRAGLAHRPDLMGSPQWMTVLVDEGTLGQSIQIP